MCKLANMHLDEHPAYQAHKTHKRKCQKDGPNTLQIGNGQYHVHHDNN
jgi:hypothetical protein